MFSHPYSIVSREAGFEERGERMEGKHNSFVGEFSIHLGDVTIISIEVFRGRAGAVNGIKAVLEGGQVPYNERVGLGELK